MSEFSFSNSSKIPSFSFLSHLFNMFFFIFLSPYLFTLLCSFSFLFFTTFFLLALFPPPNLDHGGDDDDDSPSSDSNLGFLLSVVESLVRKLSSKNDENDEGISCFEELQAYLDVFRAPPEFEVLEENNSESGYYSGEEGRESRVHVGPMHNKPNGNFDQKPFDKDGGGGGKVEADRPIAEGNKFCDEKQCSEVLEENFSESGYSGNNDGRESRNHHVGPREKEPNFDFDENPFEKDKGKLEYNEVLEEKFSESDCYGEGGGGRSHVDLIEDPPTVNLEEKPAGEDDVDKVGKNTKLDDMFCQKRDKEVKPLDTDPNKAEESKEKMTLRSGSKVMCNEGIIDAKDSTTTTTTANSEEEEEYFGTPERYWDYNNRSRRYGSMRKEKEWRRTLAFKLYEERNNVDDDHDDDGRRSCSKSEAMDLLWETYEDREHDKVIKASTKSEANDDDEEEEEEKGLERKYCCLQALKLSAGKVNLGMRKPSLVKISKALKSIGFLHHVSKHGRKKDPLN